MQGIPIDLNIYTMINIAFALVNIIPLTIVTIKVYQRDPNSQINRLFSLGVILLIFGFIMYPLGGLLWNIELFGIQVIFFSQRLVFLFAVMSQVVICWVSRVLYDGEALWNRTRNIMFIGGFLIAIVVGLLTQDAVYIIEGPPEIDTGEGTILSLILYPSLAAVLFISFFTFLKTYSDFHKDDPVIGRQAIMLATGSLLNVVALSIMLLSLLLLNHSLMTFVFISTSIAMAIMSFGFTQDASLIKLKITSELRRMTKELEKGQISEAEIQLDYIKQLAVREESGALTVRMLILESMVGIYQLQFELARNTLNDAMALSKNMNRTDLESEITKQLEHLKVHETAAMIGDSIEITHAHPGKEEDLVAVLEYLDEIINIRESMAPEKNK